jgi:hypothetical protein
MLKARKNPKVKIWVYNGPDGREVYPLDVHGRLKKYDLPSEANPANHQLSLNLPKMPGGALRSYSPNEQSSPVANPIAVSFLREEIDPLYLGSGFSIDWKEEFLLDFELRTDGFVIDALAADDPFSIDDLVPQSGDPSSR